MMFKSFTTETAAVLFLCSAAAVDRPLRSAALNRVLSNFEKYGLSIY